MAGKALAVGALGVGLSNVGTLTGSQAMQNQVNNAMKLVGIGAAFATNPLLGIGVLALTMANNAIPNSERNERMGIG